MVSPIGSGPATPDPGRPAPTGPPVGARPADPPGRAGTPVVLPDDWVGKVTDRIVSAVDSVRAKTTDPIEKVGRIVIWGLLIATAATSLLIALLILVLRLSYELIGNIPGLNKPGRSVWMIDVLIGVGLIVVGLLQINKGTKQPEG